MRISKQEGSCNALDPCPGCGNSFCWSCLGAVHEHSFGPCSRSSLRAPIAALLAAATGAAIGEGVTAAAEAMAQEDAAAAEAARRWRRPAGFGDRVAQLMEPLRAAEQPNSLELSLAPLAFAVQAVRQPGSGAQELAVLRAMLRAALNEVVSAYRAEEQRERQAQVNAERRRLQRLGTLPRVYADDGSVSDRVSDQNVWSAALRLLTPHFGGAEARAPSLEAAAAAVAMIHSLRRREAAARAAQLNAPHAAPHMQGAFAAAWSAANGALAADAAACSAAHCARLHTLLQASADPPSQVSAEVAALGASVESLAFSQLRRASADLESQLCNLAAKASAMAEPRMPPMGGPGADPRAGQVRFLARAAHDDLLVHDLPPRLLEDLMDEGDEAELFGERPPPLGEDWGAVALAREQPQPQRAVLQGAVGAQRRAEEAQAMALQAGERRERMRREERNLVEERMREERLRQDRHRFAMPPPPPGLVGPPPLVPPPPRAQEATAAECTALQAQADALLAQADAFLEESAQLAATMG
jgi:hypothetical protein